MKELTIGAAATLVNIIVAFATDGQWKTAGLGLTAVYWRLDRACSKH